MLTYDPDKRLSARYVGWWVGPGRAELSRPLKLTCFVAQNCRGASEREGCRLWLLVALCASPLVLRSNSVDSYTFVYTVCASFVLLVWPGMVRGGKEKSKRKKKSKHVCLLFCLTCRVDSALSLSPSARNDYPPSRTRWWGHARYF